MPEAASPFTLSAIAMFVGTGLLQIVGVTLLPMTRGMTAPGPTIAFALVYAGAFWLMARLVVSGMNLSLLIPLLAATVPLMAIAVSILFYHEPMSLAKVAVLVVACLMVGYASTL